MKQSNVDQLNLQGTTINLDAITRIVNDANFGKIRHLILPRNNLGDDGAKAIAEILTKNNRLSEINLSENKIGFLGVEAIAKVLKSTKITGIDLSRNKIGYLGAEAIAKVLKDTEITRINLSQTNMEHEGVELIFDALEKSKIIDIDLSHNFISDKDAKSIAKACKQLKKLNLYQTQISLNGFTHIINALINSPVTSLNVVGNGFGDDSVRQIASVLKKSKINHLNLEKSKMTSVGLKSLTTALKGSRVQCLNLAENHPKDKGAELIAKVLKDTAIVILKLDDNGISEKGGKWIAEVLKDTFISHLTLRNNKKLWGMFLFEIEHQLQENQIRIRRIAAQFGNFVVRGKNDLDFVVRGRLSKAFDIIVFTKTLSINKKGWTGMLVSKYRRDYGEAEIEEFVDRVEVELGELLSGLKIDLPTMVKLLLQCKEIGFEGVVEGFLSKHRDNYLSHELVGVLDPAVDILLGKHSPIYDYANPGEDELKISQNEKWGEFIKDRQLIAPPAV